MTDARPVVPDPAALGAAGQAETQHKQADECGETTIHGDNLERNPFE